MKITRIAGAALASLLVLGSGVVASAQTVSTTASASINPSFRCVILARDLYVGSRSSSDITSLQTYLAGEGYFNQAAIGIFGPATLRAVIAFQRTNGVPATGYFGPLSRAAIARRCGNPTGPVSIVSISPASGAVGTSVTLTGTGFTNDNTINFGGGVVMHIAANSSNSLTFTIPSGIDPACRYSEPACAIATRMTTPGTYAVSVQNSNGTSNSVNFTVTDGSITTPAPVIYSIRPSAGPVGTVVSITGFGFTGDNMIHFGSGVIAHVPITSSIAIACTTDPACHGGINQTIQFTVPSSVGPYCQNGMMCPMYMQLITPGDYKVSVENTNGTSGSVTYTVTSNSNNPLSINGLDAPSSLALGQSGTWTVHATSNTANQNLHYSVTWGDEVYTNSGSAVMSPGTQSVQTSASFTHSYQRSGTYAPVFTVSDDSGHTLTTSSSVTVTPLY